MKTSPSFTVYHWVKSTFTPSFTGWYLLTESIVLFLSLSVLLSTTLSGLQAGFLGLGPVLFILVLLYTPPDWRILDEAIVLTQSHQKFILSTLVGLLPVLLSFSLGGLTGPSDVVVGCGGVVLYAAGIHYRGQKYRGTRQFFTDSRSPDARDWYDASVAFEQGLAHYDKQNFHRAYHWLKTAQSAYKERETYAPRERQQKIAQELKSATGVILTDVCSSQRLDVVDEYETHLAAAIEATHYARCDVCNRVRPIENCHRILDNEGIEVELLCNRCNYDRYSKPGNAGRKTNEDVWADDYHDETQNTKRQDTRNPNVNVESDDQMSVALACDELGLSESFSTDELKDAFRTRVKEVHPDMGGSTEEFKRVKEARERLEDETE